MPYKNIVFVKLEKRLFNDHRWYMMSEKAQLNFIRFLLFAAETYNKIPKNLDAIKRAFKTDQEILEIASTIDEIKSIFPKFKENKHFYYFDGFDEKTNYIPEKAKHRKSQVLPKDGVDIDKEEDKEKDKKKTNIGGRMLLEEEYFLNLLPIDLEPEKILAWADWVDFRKDVKKKLVKTSAKKQIDFLLKQPDFIGCINQSIKNQWQGLFEVKNGTNKSSVGASPEFLAGLVADRFKKERS